MGPEELQKLRDYCADFAKFRDNTVDGNGNNLHDIKNTFDYVKKSVDQYNLTSTSFGSELSKKVEDASNVLSELWICFQNLEKSIEGFAEEQEARNNSGLPEIS